MRAALASVSLLALAVPAAAAPALPIADGVSLAFHDKTIVVRKGKVEAKVQPADGLTRARYDAATGLVTIDYDTPVCTIPAQVTYSLGALKARLENEPALGLHRKKSWKAALAGFQRAIAADPSWVIPAYNAASAQQLLGDRDGAIATLAPWLAKAPIRTYVQIHADPELAPLATRPEISALAAAQRGDIEVTSDGITGDVAYSPARKLLAYTRDEGSWGNSQFAREIVIYSAGGDGAVLPLVGFDDTRPDCYASDGTRGTTCAYEPAAKQRLAARAAAAQARLQELGFTRAKLERGVVRAPDANKTKLSFPGHALGLVSVDGAYRLLRNDTEIVAGTLPYPRVTGAVLVDDLHLLVLWSLRPGAEGCEGTDPTAVQVVPLPAP